MEMRANLIGVINVQRSAGDGVSNPCYILELPESLSHEIFFRLPIKTIMRSKCVCTKWYKLISEPDFSIWYSRNSSIKPLIYFPSFDNPGLVDLIEISEDRVCTPSLIDPNLSGGSAECESSFIGLCDGLLCFLDLKGLPTVNVINPIMGKPLALPAIENHYGPHNSVKYHFGFNSSGNNFKVMRIVHNLILKKKGIVHNLRLYKRGYTNIVEIKIFTIGIDDQWRSLPTDLIDFEAYMQMISFGGAFHWIPFVSNNARLEAGKLGGLCRPDLKIHTFDLNEEEPGQFFGPPGVGLQFNRALLYVGTPLTIYDGRFSLLDFSKMETTIWTMEKYADAESWTRIVVLRTWMPTAINCSCYPIAKFQDEEILFLTYPFDKLVSCNIREGTSSEIGTCEFLPVRRLYTPNFFLEADKMVREGAGRA